MLLLGGNLQQLQNAFLNKVKRWGIISDDRSIDDIWDEIDYFLFNRNAVFQPLLASYFAKWRCSLYGMKMRKSGHNYSLPILETEIARKSFLDRMLYKYQ